MTNSPKDTKLIHPNRLVADAQSHRYRMQFVKKYTGDFVRIRVNDADSRV